MNRRRRSLICVVLAVTLLTGAVLNAQATTVQEAEQQVQEAEQQVDEAEKQADEAEKKAQELEQKKNTATEEQKALAEELNRIIGEVEDAQEQLDKKEEEIAETEEELVQAKVDESTQYESMKKRIKFMYENGNTQMIGILFESESIGEFLNKAEYVSQISSYDREMLIEFQETVKEVERKEEELQAEYEELTVLQDNLIAKQDKVDALLEEKNLQLADLENQIGANSDELKALQEQVELAKQKKAQAESAKAAAIAAEEEAKKNQNSGGSYLPGGSEIVVSGNGQFTNPCPGGYISSRFGYRTFDNSFHKGLDLAAPTGTPTYAADAGRVIIAGWSSSAGNWVVINHGNGFVTKYMHHSALAVRAGDYVQKGQQIGYVGNTGNSFGAHLHFQVEYNGTAVDPELYL